MKFLYEQLQKHILQRKESEYEGVKPETRNILKYIISSGYLRKPQISALETYVYLKEIANNKPLAQVYFDKVDSSLLRKNLFSIEEREAMDDMEKEEKLQLIQKKLEYLLGSDDYSNQVYALTMGTGKTILMTVFMLYDIVLSYYYPDDFNFAQNFLVFAPDKTIIESLKEIKDFDYSLVIPSEYYDSLLQIKYHYLEDTKQKLTVQGNYNIIITNSQKIIVKTKKGINGDTKKTLFASDTERELHQVENEKLMALKSLSRLAIFVDEAHHSFGETLEGDLKKTKETINRIHANKALVGCINMTGTPYIEGNMIPNVVCYYGLKQGIEQGILKQVDIMEFGEVKSEEFLMFVMQDFRTKYGSKTVEGKRLKIAIYTSSVNELREVRRTLETVICKNLQIPTDCILENHQEASNQEIEEFRRLDSIESKKQIILLVQKGTEGRNCKSLFATALYRRPQKQVFVLQSSTRCLRAIGDNTTKASIYLSRENYNALDKELKQNFDIGLSDLQHTQVTTQPITCTVLKKKSIEVNKRIKEITAMQQTDYKNIVINEEGYKHKEIYLHKTSIKTSQDGTAKIEQGVKDTQAINTSLINKQYSWYEILRYIQRHTHIGFDTLKKVLYNNGYGKEVITTRVSSNNKLLDYIIDEICRQYYSYNEQETEIKEELQIVKVEGTYTFEVDTHKLNKQPKLVVYKEDCEQSRLGFHINPYNFDSTDELELLKFIRSKLDKDDCIEDIYFTGSGTEKTSDFFFEYSIYKDGYHSIKKYFPDLLVEIKKPEGATKYLVIEVKGSDEESDYYQAKQIYDNGDKRISNYVFAKEVGFREFCEWNKQFEYKLVFNATLPSKQQETLQKVKEMEG